MSKSASHFGRGGPAARILIVGGDDVEKRIDLMRTLSDRFRFAAAGSDLGRAEEFADAGFPFFYYPMDRGTNPLSDARTFFFLGRVMRRLQPDLVHAFATKPAVWGRLAARWAGVPAVMGTLPGLGSLYSFNDFRTRVVRRLYQPLQRRACRSSDLTVFQNRKDFNQFVDTDVAPRERSVVIPGSGVRTEEFSRENANPSAVAAFRSAVGAREGDLVITMISRLIRSKGVREFAEAARLLAAEGRAVRFVLAGPEDHGSWDSLSPGELEEVRGSVSYLGERADVRTLYGGSDIFVLPSYREGLPRVLLEAASMGLPLVATRNPGCEEVVEEGRNGFLVEGRNGVALAEKIKVLVDQPLLRKRFSRESRTIAVNRFDLRVIAEATASHYQRLLKGANRVQYPPHLAEEDSQDAQSEGTASA